MKQLGCKFLSTAIKHGSHCTAVKLSITNISSKTVWTRCPRLDSRLFQS